MRELRIKLGMWLLELDDWFASKGIYFNWFKKDNPNFVNFLCKWGFWLTFYHQEGGVKI